MHAVMIPCHAFGNHPQVHLNSLLCLRCLLPIHDRLEQIQCLTMQVWVGFEYLAATGADPSSQASNLKFKEQRHRKSARQKALDSQPSLPSLMVADVAVLPS